MSKKTKSEDEKLSVKTSDAIGSQDNIKAAVLGLIKPETKVETQPPEWMRLSDKTKEALENYLTTRLGVPLKFPTQEIIDQGRGQIGMRLESWIIDNPMYFGVFKHIILSMKVVVKAYKGNKEGDIWNAWIDFQYNHINGGRNGYDTNLKLEINNATSGMVEL